MEEELLFERDGQVGVMTMNRPAKLNALSPGITGGLLDVLRRVDGDPGIRALLLKGNGRAFCAGGDVPNFPTGEENRARREQAAANRRPARETSVTLALQSCRKLVVAAVHGYAVGGGLSIALACDYRVAAAGARFAPIQARRGIIPDMGLTHLLPKAVGAYKAMELTLRAAEGGFIEADEALALGLVTRVVPPESLLEEAMALAQAIARGPTVALGLAKEGIYRGAVQGLEAALEFEAPAITTCFGTEDCHEAARAFVEKRAPVFVGR